MAYIGPNWVPDGTPGSTPGTVPAGQGSATTTNAPPTFMGLQPPFRREDDPAVAGGYRLIDASGKVVRGNQADVIWTEWNKTEAARKRVEDLQKNPGQVVAPADMELALNQYRDAIAQAREQYAGILGHEPTPSPTEVLSLPVGSTVDVSKVSTLSPADRLKAALQGQTTVEGTTLDTAPADQARGLQLQNITDLQASARGEGQAANLAAARLAQALRAGAKQGAGIALGSTGAARKGAARAGVLAANQNALDAGAKVAELEASTALQSQGQLAGALQGVRGQDVDVAAKKAALEQERKTLQGQLDAARAANDQDAINAVNAKMADLDQRTKEFNASETNKAQGRKEDQDFEGQKVAIDRGLEVSRLAEEQRVANERLKLDASKAATDAAAGLLSENDRQAQLDLAYKKLNAAEEAADKAFWQGIITSLISRAAGAAIPGAPKAAHGGLITEPTELMVGEDGPELIVPVNEVTAKLAAALALKNKPFDREQAPALPRLLAALKGMSPQAEESEPPRLPPKVVVLLAAGNAKARKAVH